MSSEHFCTQHVLASAANRLIGEVVRSRRRPLLGPSPDNCVGDPISRLLTVGSTPIQHSVLNVKALVGAFNQEKALVGAFSVIVQPVVEPMEHYTALILRITAEWGQWQWQLGGGSPRPQEDPDAKRLGARLQPGQV